jgi:exo-beta-1,3-glucanase (GH17 family)
MSYTPYTSSGQCKSADEVMADITIIAGKGFVAVRIYATDCSGLVNVGAACKANNIKLIIGVFIEASGISGAQSQVQEIIEWGEWEIVEMIVIGNEAVFNGYCSASELAQFITSCKQSFQGAGYSGPCTTTEPLNILQQYASELCGCIDVVASNIQPFFNSDVSADQAGSFVKGQLDLTGQCCPGLKAYNLECGWPTNGSNNGAAVPGTSEQSTAMNGVLEECGEFTVVFSYSDDPWKGDGDFGVEPYFGLIDLF